MNTSEPMGNIEEPPVEQPTLAGSATLLAVGNAASRILGLAREIMITALFGATGEVSAFRLASQVPLLFYDFLIGGMLSAALVPVLSQHLQLRSRAEFVRLVSILTTMLGIVLFVLVVVLEMFAPQIAWLLGGGFNKNEPALLDLTSYLLRLTIPAIWFMCMAGMMTATLYASERFSFPALATAIYNLGILITAPLLVNRFGIVSLAFGMLVGTVAQLAVMVFGLWRADVRLQFHVNWHHPALRQIIRLYIPIAAGITVGLLQVALDRRLATGTQPQSIAWMSNATTLQQLPLGLISVAIALAALPRLSQFFAQGDEESYRATLGRGVRMVLLLIVPSAVVLWTLSEPIVRILFERNRFTPEDTVQVAAALDIYVVGMLFAAVDYPLNFAFYARQNTRLPALVGVVSVGFYLVTAWALLAPMGYLGLVWADTAKQAGHMLIMVALISWQVKMRQELLGHGTLWILLAGLPATIVTWAIATVLDARLAAGFGHDLILVVVAGGGGILVYVLILQRLHLPEVETISKWFLQRIWHAREG